jgi:hypothetical protein
MNLLRCSFMLLISHLVLIALNGLQKFNTDVTELLHATKKRLPR